MIQLVECTYELHAEAILAIFNDAIANSTALYDYEPRSLESMSAWFKTKEAGNFPVIGAVSQTGELMGFASYGGFRAWPAYQYTVEHSVYIQPQYQGQGLASALMQRLIAKAVEQQYHVLIGGVDSSNAGSVALHERLGFEHAGTLKQVGFKFEKWLDLNFYQLVLETPADPKASSKY